MRRRNLQFHCQVLHIGAGEKRLSARFMHGGPWFQEVCNHVDVEAWKCDADKDSESHTPSPPSIIHHSSCINPSQLLSPSLTDPGCSRSRSPSHWPKHLFQFQFQIQFPSRSLPDPFHSMPKYHVLFYVIFYTWNRSRSRSRSQPANNEPPRLASPRHPAFSFRRDMALLAGWRCQTFSKRYCVVMGPGRGDGMWKKGGEGMAGGPYCSCSCERIAGEARHGMECEVWL